MIRSISIPQAAPSCCLADELLDPCPQRSKAGCIRMPHGKTKRHQSRHDVQRARLGLQMAYSADRRTAHALAEADCVPDHLHRSGHCVAAHVHRRGTRVVLTPEYTDAELTVPGDGVQDTNIQPLCFQRASLLDVQLQPGEDVIATSLRDTRRLQTRLAHRLCRRDAIGVSVRLSLLGRRATSYRPRPPEIGAEATALLVPRRRLRRRRSSGAACLPRSEAL
jgi:hypothetical protein